MPSSNAKQPTDHKPRKTTKKASNQPSPVSQGTPIPVPEDPNSKYAANTWLNGGIGGMEDFVVPSGQLCLVRRPGLEGLMKAGVLHNVDSLTQVVNEKHIKRVTGKGKKDATAEIDMASLMKDDESMAEVTNVVDKVVAYCVVKPEIHRTPDDVTRRQSGVIYADMVDLMDKMHIFNFVVGGTRDIETFRGELDELVGSVETGEGVPSTAE